MIMLGLDICAVFFFAFVLPSATSQLSPSENFPHSAILDRRNENVLLYWKFDEIYITFEIHGQTTGWVGMGISPNGAMIGADLFVGWVKNGVASVTDHHGGSRNTFPSMDEEQNLDLLGGGESEGWTWLKFRRQLAGCEARVDRSITTSTLRIIWALGEADPAQEDIENGDYHGSQPENRGVRSLFLLEPTAAAPQFTKDAESFKLLSGNVTLPTRDTYYNCRYLEFPRVASKRHIIAIEPLIDPGNEDLVHHILMYECTRPPMDISVVGRSHECYQRNMPRDFRSCSLTIYAWAIGGGVFTYPEHVGFPFDTEASPQYVLIEVHYDNANLRTGVVDNSGLRLIYTENLRQYDAGVLEVGRKVFPQQSLIVPPKAESFVIAGECHAACIGGAIDDINRKDIKIFAGFLHSHLLGRAMKVRHFTANETEELPFLLEDDSYDFNYQEVKVFTEEVTFQRGDSLQMMCNYNSTKRNNLTLGGVSTQNEMCLSYIYYYPKLSVTSCRSYPLGNELLLYFNISGFRLNTRNVAYLSLDDLVVTNPPHLAGRTVGDVVQTVDWTQGRIEEFQRFIRLLRRRSDCEGRDDIEEIIQRQVGYQRLFSFPTVPQPYQTPPPQCVTPTSAPVTTTSLAHTQRGSFSLVAAIIFTHLAVKL